MNKANALCPYPHHIDAIKITNTSVITVCSEINGCQMPIVFCESCEEPNRTVAYHCTQCKTPLDLPGIERRMLEQMQSSRDPELWREINLASHGAQVARELLPALGFLFVRTIGAGVLVFGAYDPKTPIAAIQEKGAEADGMAFIPGKRSEKQKPHVLVAMQQRLWRFDFLPKLEQSEETITKLTPDAVLRFQPFRTANGVTYFVHYPAQDKFALWTQNSDRPEWEFRTRLGWPIQTGSGQIVFYAEKEVFSYDPSSRRITTVAAPPDAHLDCDNFAAYSPSSREVVIPGEGYLYRLIMKADAPYLTTVNRESFNAFRFSAGDHDQLMIGDSNDLYLMNAFSGEISWTLEKNLSIQANCEQFSPRQFGRYLAFVALTQRGRQREVGLVDLSNLRRPPLWCADQKRLTAPPVLCGDKLVLATINDGEQPVLKVYQIK